MTQMSIAQTTRRRGRVLVNREVSMYLAFGIALVIVGATIMTIITVAEDSRTEGVDVSGIGWTLLVGGALTLILALIHRARRPDRELRIEHDAPADRRGERDAA